MVKSVSLGYGEAALRVTLCDCRLAAQSMEDRGIIPGISVRVCMATRVGAYERSSHSTPRLIDVAENPRHPRHEYQHGNSSILADCPSSNSVGFLTCVEQLDSALERFAGRYDAPHEHENHRLPSYRIEQCWAVTSLLGGNR